MSNKKILLIVAAAIAVIVVFKDNRKAKLTACLQSQGLKVYGASWCRYTKDLKSDFGRHWKNVSYVDCDADKAACAKEGIKGYPSATLEAGVNKKFILPADTVDTLVSLSNCASPLKRMAVNNGHVRNSVSPGSPSTNP